MVGPQNSWGHFEYVGRRITLTQLVEFEGNDKYCTTVASLEEDGKLRAWMHDCPSF
jgi:hypothetical protein